MIMNNIKTFFYFFKKIFYLIISLGFIALSIFGWYNLRELNSTDFLEQEIIIKYPLKIIDKNTIFVHFEDGKMYLIKNFSHIALDTIKLKKNIRLWDKVYIKVLTNQVNKDTTQGFIEIYGLRKKDTEYIDIKTINNNRKRIKLALVPFLFLLGFLGIFSTFSNKEITKTQRNIITGIIIAYWLLLAIFLG